MPVEIQSKHVVRIDGKNPVDVARGLVKLVELTSGKESIEYNDAVDTYLNLAYGNSKTERGRISSLPFEGSQYTLQYTISEEQTHLLCHPGGTPGVDPIKNTADMLLRLTEQ